MVVSSFPSIINYVAGLKQQQVKNTVNLDIYAPSGKERSQSVAWQAHVDANLGDLVVSSLYVSVVLLPLLTYGSLTCSTLLMQIGQE